MVPLIALVTPMIMPVVDATADPSNSSQFEQGQALGVAGVQFICYAIGAAAAIAALRSRNARSGETSLPNKVKLPALIGLSVSLVLLCLMFAAAAWAILHN